MLGWHFYLMKKCNLIGRQYDFTVVAYFLGHPVCNTPSSVCYDGSSLSKLRRQSVQQHQSPETIGTVENIRIN